MKAEEGQTRAILWNALRLDLSNSHISYCLSFFFFFKQIVQKDGALLRSDVSAEHLREMGKRRALIKAHFGCQANTSFSFTSAAQLLGVPTSSPSRFF